MSPTEPTPTKSAPIPASVPVSVASTFAPAINDFSSSRAASAVSKAIPRDSADTQDETLLFTVIEADNEASTQASLAGAAIPAVQLPTRTGNAPGGLSAPTPEALTSRGAQAVTPPADQQESLPPGTEQSPHEETGPRVDPGETRFAPQMLLQLLDGQPVDIQALEGLLNQFLHQLTDLSGNWPESEGSHDVIALVVGSVAVAGLEAGRRLRKRRTVPSTVEADWLGWIDLDGPSSETLR